MLREPKSSTPPEQHPCRPCKMLSVGGVCQSASSTHYARSWRAVSTCALSPEPTREDKVQSGDRVRQITSSGVERVGSVGLIGKCGRVYVRWDGDRRFLAAHVSTLFPCEDAA